jgi:hypothetical protein
MVARIVRKQIAEKFRKKTREMGIPTEEPQKVAAVKHLNMLLGRHRNSNYYWRTLKRSLVRKFPVRPRTTAAPSHVWRYLTLHVITSV